MQIVLRLRTALVLVALAALLAGVSSLGNGFAYDDDSVVVRNPFVTDPGRAARIWTTPYWGSRAAGGLYRPMAIFSYALNHRLGGLRPFGYHLVNVLLHAAVALLVLLAAREFLPLPGALAAALLFAAHPVHTEAVANVVGRAELLAALGFLGAWLLHGGGAAAAARTPGAAAAAGAWTARRPDAPAAWGRRVAAALLFAVGVFSKEVAAALPVALLARDLFRRRRPDLRGYALLLVVLVVYLGLRRQVLGGFAVPPGETFHRVDNVIATLPPLRGAWTALLVFGRYVGLLAFPRRLSADYSYPEILPAGAGDPGAWLGFLAAMGMAALVMVGLWKTWRAAGAARGRAPAAAARGPAAAGAPAGRLPGAWSFWTALGMGLALFGITLALVSNLVLRIGTVMAERLLYLPSAGFLVAAAACWEAARERSGPAGRRWLAALLAALVAAGAAGSTVRNRDWRNSHTIAAATVRSAPRSARARYNHGVSLYEAGRVEDAIRELRRAVELDSSYVEGWVNLGGYNLELGRIDEARASLLRAVDSDSTWWSSLISLGALEIRAGRPALALGWLNRAVALDAGVPDAWSNMGLARGALGDSAGAIQAWRRSIELGSDDAGTFNNLAWYLALTRGSLDEALRHAERAVALDPQGAHYDTLAEVLYRLGRIEAARRAWRQALAQGVGDPEAIRRKVGGL